MTNNTEIIESGIRVESSTSLSDVKEQTHVETKTFGQTALEITSHPLPAGQLHSVGGICSFNQSDVIGIDIPRYESHRQEV
ncbi:hypothetical protein BGX28_007374 [Mortierella sp. GBA30]|nr:hypothetical protein BGX28_007374 [Mortierella sp. GBA30]